MAKKDLKNLVDCIVGRGTEEKRPPLESAEKDIPQGILDDLKITPEKVEELNRKRRANVGQPKKEEREIPRVREHRATFIVDEDIVRKLKYVSLMESKLLKDLVSEIFTDYLGQWEEVNGKIKLPKKGSI